MRLDIQPCKLTAFAHFSRDFGSLPRFRAGFVPTRIWRAGMVSYGRDCVGSRLRHQRIIRSPDQLQTNRIERPHNFLEARLA